MSLDSILGVATIILAIITAAVALAAALAPGQRAMREEVGKLEHGGESHCNAHGLR